MHECKGVFITFPSSGKDTIYTKKTYCRRNHFMYCPTVDCVEVRTDFLRIFQASSVIGHRAIVPSVSPEQA
jgi:hypothetical protein